MKKIIFIFLAFLLSIFSLAQSYVSIDTMDLKIREEQVKEYKNIHERFINGIKEKYSRKERQALLMTFEEVQKEFIEGIEEGEYQYDSRFYKMLEEIVKEIQNKNPNVPKDIKILLSKQSGLNAYNLGEGTIVVNMGTFYYLDNESQLAGIIGHEIGHQMLNHVMKTQLRRIQKNEIKAKKSVKTLKNQRYNKGEKALQLFKEVLYEEGEERRNHEKEADIKGVELLKNTKYNAVDIISAFQLMEKYDTLRPLGLKEESYKKFFNLPNQAFKDKWLEKEDFSGYDYTKYVDKIDKDSISSHPELDERIKYLKEQFPELKDKKGTLKATKEFEELQEIAKHEQVPNLYMSQNYGDAIYISLLRLQRGEEETYYKEWLGKLFLKIYEARKAYKLNRYLDTVTPKDQSESYQQYLNFMWNLSLNEIKNVADYYTKLPEPKKSVN